MNSYEAKQEAKRERLLERADKAEAESRRRNQTANEMASAIPLGQPILVGHLSEKRDRNYRGRIDSNYRKSYEADKKAQELRARAHSVGTGGVSSDDPDAVAKLKEELAPRVKKQEMMKRVNAACRKGQRTPKHTQHLSLIHI